MNNYKGVNISSHTTSDWFDASRQTIKPFKDDGLIQHIHYIEKVGLENLPTDFIDFFRIKYGSNKRINKSVEHHNKIAS